MTDIPSYVVENPNFEPYKPKKPYNLYSTLLPIFLSIVTYILIFHVLDVSPYLIFNDTKILLFISNALIIIIAADYDAFTDKENYDFYAEYMTAMRSDAREIPRPENSGYFVEEIKNREKQEEAVGMKDIPQYLLHKETTTEQNIHITANKGEICNARNLVYPKPYGRSKSDKARGSIITKEQRPQEIKDRPKSYDRSKTDSSKWVVVHKEKKDKEAEEATEKWENVREESEEFSKMSNEELNRRVEDFIQRFNRDIRRQIFV